jgi:hypothetical protein
MADEPDALAPWSEAPIVANGWDEQRIFQYLTQECGLKPAKAIDEMNVRLREMLWCIRVGNQLQQIPPVLAFINKITWRLKGKKVETVIWPIPTVEPILFRALPDDVQAMWSAESIESSRKKHPTLQTYIEHQREWKRTHGGVSASREDDQTWAESNGFASRYVRDVLRPQWVETLPANEQIKHEFRGAAPKKKGRHRAGKKSA